jgi:AAHS family benzoate transporter-like MFS transporter
MHAKGSPICAFEWLDNLKFSRFHARLLVLGTLITIFAGYSSQIIAYILPPALKEWHLTPLEAGTMISYGFLGLMIGAAGLGIVSDRLGRKNAILLIVAAFSVFNGAAYFAPNFKVFCVLRFLSGLGIGGAIPLTVTLLGEFAPSRIRARFLTVVGSGFTVGWVVAGLVSMAVVPRFGWRAVLLVGVLPLFLLPVIKATLPESVRFLAARKRFPEAIGELRSIERVACFEPCTWTHESFAQSGALANVGFRDLFQPGLRTMTLLVWGTYLFNMLALYGLSTWLPSLLANTGLSLVKSYSYGIVQALGAAIGGVLLGCLMDAFGRKLGLCVSFFIGGLSVICFGFVTSATSLYIAGAATGIFMVGVPAALHVVAGEIYPTRFRSTGAGWAYAIGRLGSIMGPIIGGILQMAGFSFSQFFLVFSIPCFICMILVALFPVGVRNESLETVSKKVLAGKQGK